MRVRMRRSSIKWGPRLQGPLSQWREQLNANSRLPSYWLPWPREDGAVAAPVPWAVPRRMDMDVGMADDAATVDQTLTTGEVTLAKWPSTAAIHQRELKRMWQGAGLTEVWAGTKDQVWGEKVQLAAETHSLQCYRCQEWGHMAWECPTLASALNHPSGMQPMPQLATATHYNSRSCEFPFSTRTSKCENGQMTK